MVLKLIRIGSSENVFQYDNTDFGSAIESDEPIKAGAPVDPEDVLRLADTGSLVGDVVGPAGAVDSNIAEFDGVTGKKIKDGGLSHANVSDAITKKHTQNTDTGLGAVGTKNPPIDADKALYRDSAAADVLVTSTWAQVKAFLKTYFDTIYVAVAGVYRYAASIADDGTTALPTITANYAALCEVIVSSAGVIDANATFLIDSTGNVTAQIDSGNVVYNADTDTKLCIGTAAAQNPLTVKNRLGGAKNILINMKYN